MKSAQEFALELREKMTAGYPMSPEVEARDSEWRRLVEKNDRSRIVAESDLRRLVEEAQAQRDTIKRMWNFDEAEIKRLKGELVEARRIGNAVDAAFCVTPTNPAQQQALSDLRAFTGYYSAPIAATPAEQAQPTCVCGVRLSAGYHRRGCPTQSQTAEQAQPTKVGWCRVAPSCLGLAGHAPNTRCPGAAEQAQGEAAPAQAQQRARPGEMATAKTRESAPKCDRCSAPISSYSSSRSCSRCDAFWTEAYQAGRAFEREYGAAPSDEQIEAARKWMSLHDTRVAELTERVEALTARMADLETTVYVQPAPPPPEAAPRICARTECNAFASLGSTTCPLHIEPPEAAGPFDLKDAINAALAKKGPEAAGPAVQFTGVCRVCHELVSDGREVHRECEAAGPGHAFVRHCGGCWNCSVDGCMKLEKDHADSPIPEGK